MCFKRFVRGTAVAAALFGAVLRPAAATQTEPGAGRATVNCIAAIVANQVITLADVKIAEAFEMFGRVEAPDAAGRRRAILEKLIDQKVVITLARENVAPDPSKTERTLADLLARLGADAAKRRLEDFGLVPADLLRVMEEKILSEAIVADRFGRSSGVSLQEIERYYAETYAPEQKRLGREPKPLIDVLGAIEETLRTEKTAGRIALWIKSLRGQTEIEVRADCLK
jgi:hypothetical protein